MAATYEPIASTTLGSSAASVTFGSGGTLSQGYTDLRLVIRSKATAAGVHRSLLVRFNGDTGSNYSATRLYGNGSSATSDRLSSQTGIDVGFLPNTSNNFGTSLIDVMSYSSGSVYKTLLCSWESQGGASGSQYVAREVGLWRSTSAITSITLLYSADDIESGSTFALYGIKAA